MVNFRNGYGGNETVNDSKVAMTQKISTDAVLDELAKVDQELKELQKELVDTLQINDDLAKNIEEKEADLQLKESRLTSLKERNAADYEQLEVESVAMTEKFDHQIMEHENKVLHLDLQYKRFMDTINENQSLKECIEILLQQTEKDRANHAEKMHEMNKDMNSLRHELEEKMRKQLARMDISYQKEAFAALSEAHKKAMFQNAKLKDEVALQGVGLNNLGSRLGKQMKAYEVCCEELQYLNSKSNTLRERITAIAKEKVSILKMRSKVEKEIRELNADNKGLLKQFQADPSFNDCITSVEKLRKNVANTECELIMWNKRLALLHLLHGEIKPTSDNERKGRYNPETFALKGVLTQPDMGAGILPQTKPRMQSICEMSTVSSVGNDNIIKRESANTENDSVVGNVNINPQQSSVAENFVNKSGTVVTADTATTASSIKASEIQSIMMHDETLAAALAPLSGKEGFLMVSTSSDNKKGNKKKSLSKKTEGEEERDQNMCAWATIQILDLWKQSKTIMEEKKSKAVSILAPIVTSVQVNEDNFPVVSFEHELNKEVSFAMASEISHSQGFGDVSTNQSFEISKISDEETLIEEEEGLEISAVAGGERKIPLEVVIFNENKVEEQVGTPVPQSKSNNAELSPRMHGKSIAVKHADKNFSVKRPIDDCIESKSVHSKQMSDNDNPCLQSDRQAERDFIENGKLQEEDLDRVWDEAFDLYAENKAQSNIHALSLDITALRTFDATKGSELSLTADAGWFKQIDKPRRYPETTSHLVSLTEAERSKEQQLRTKKTPPTIGSINQLNKGNISNALQKPPVVISPKSGVKSPASFSSGRQSSSPVAISFLIKEPRIKIPKPKSTLSDVGPPVVVNLIGGDKDRLRDALESKHDAQEEEEFKKLTSSAKTFNQVEDSLAKTNELKGIKLGSSTLPPVIRIAHNINEAKADETENNRKSKKKLDPLTTTSKLDNVKFQRTGFPSALPPSMFKSKSTVEIGSSISNATASLPRRQQRHALSTTELLQASKVKNKIK